MRKSYVFIGGLAAIALAVFVWQSTRTDFHDDSTEAMSVTPAVPDTSSELEPNDIMRIADIDFGSYSNDLVRFIKLEPSEPLPSAIAKIEAYFTPRGGNVEGYKIGDPQTESTFSSFDAEGGKVTLVERTNMRDDSVKAEKFYAVFKKTGDTEILVDYGMKIKCHRGNNTTNWQTTLCP